MMQLLQAGNHRFILLELDPDIIGGVARHAGFECEVSDTPKSIVLDIEAIDRKVPLLLFDAGDPANLGWFSRCQFYVDGRSGSVMQTPISVANRTDRRGDLRPTSLRIRLAKELPASFRLPGRTAVNEQTVYGLLLNFLAALLTTGVGLCGGPVVRPLSGRTEAIGARN